MLSPRDIGDTTRASGNDLRSSDRLRYTSLYIGSKCGSELNISLFAMLLEEKLRLQNWLQKGYKKLQFFTDLSKYNKYSKKICRLQFFLSGYKLIFQNVTF